MQPQGKAIRLPQTVAIGMLVTIVVLGFCVIMLFIASNIQRRTIGNLDTRLAAANTMLEKAQEENQIWETNFHIWVNRAVEEELDTLSMTPLKFPPPITIPEEEGKDYQDEMTDDEVIAYVIENFGSTEESGPGN